MIHIFVKLTRKEIKNKESPGLFRLMPELFLIALFTVFVRKVCREAHLGRRDQMGCYTHMLRSLPALHEPPKQYLYYILGSDEVTQYFGAMLPCAAGGEHHESASCNCAYAGALCLNAIAIRIPHSMLFAFFTVTEKVPKHFVPKVVTVLRHSRQYR